MAEHTHVCLHLSLASALQPELKMACREKFAPSLSPSAAFADRKGRFKIPGIGRVRIPSRSAWLRSLAPRRVAPAANGPLVSAATVLLPTADLAWYDEEYWGELLSLVRSGTSLIRQLRYVIRPTVRSVSLATVVRFPRRNRAAP
jgi:hypothetical protein